MAMELAAGSRLDEVMGRLRKKFSPATVENQEIRGNRRAEFLPGTVKFFGECGIDSSFIDPVPLGYGSNHVVFKYDKPGETPRVVKIPRRQSVKTLTGTAESARRVTAMIKSHFPKYFTPTDICSSSREKDRYCVVQDFVKGVPLIHRYKKAPAIMAQLEEIAAANRELVAKYGLSLDFVGNPGMKSWWLRQLQKVRSNLRGGNGDSSYTPYMQVNAFNISNFGLMKTASGPEIRILDNEFFDMSGNAPPLKRLVSTLAYSYNRWFMKHYFGIEIGA